MRASVTFLPDLTVVDVTRGQSVLHVIRKTGRPIGYSCRGQGICTACTVWVAGPAGDISLAEEQLLAKVAGPLKRGRFQRRIACLAKVDGPIEITVDYW